MLYRNILTILVKSSFISNKSTYTYHSYKGVLDFDPISIPHCSYLTFLVSHSSHESLSHFEHNRVNLPLLLVT